MRNCLFSVGLGLAFFPLMGQDTTGTVSQAMLAPAPEIEITRDDHVATIMMDFDPNAGHGGQLWTVGTDGTDPCGYRIQWWPDPSEIQNIDFTAGCSTQNSAGTTIVGTPQNPYQIVTPNPVAQIQPIANNVTYHVKVEKLNSFGQICSPATELTFAGGDGSRVLALKANMTFFDDFNLPVGPADELKWNNAMGPQADPRFNLFFVNHQCHVHTLNGTRNDGAGDRSQVAQRSRKPIMIEEGVRRQIVFDMDGLFSGRSVWYLDLNPVETDLMGHLSFFDFDGETGLPADVFRLRAVGNEISVNLINSAGASQKIASSHLPDYGRRMHPNVRRSFDVRLGIDGVEVFVDGTSVIDASFPIGLFKPGIYYPLWSTVGYNTSKDDNPYFLSHWDNFGFDGPDAENKTTLNYVTRIAGTDLQKASEYSGSHPSFTIQVPDNIHPAEPGISHEVWLVFSYQKNDFSTFDIEPGDYLTFNGTSFPLPEGANNSSPEVPGLVDYSGSPISNRIKIEDLEMGETSLVNTGDNTIQFFATNTGIMNVHLEVKMPQGASSAFYTQPAEIHAFVNHSDLPKLGLPAKITFIDDQELESTDNGLSGPIVSDTMEVEILAGNTHWANWAPQWLNMPANSAEFWSTGSTVGISQVNLFMRPKGSDVVPGELIASIDTDLDAPAPQIRYTFKINTREYGNGEYELFLQATDSKGIKSHPGYHGFAFMWDASEISGAYYPISITIENENTFTFSGLSGPLWTTQTSWQNNLMPPEPCDGTIIIDSDCVVPLNHPFEIPLNCSVIINSGKEFTVIR